MPMLTDQDRAFLTAACGLAQESRRPPKKLGLRVEPVWAALLAVGKKELVSAAFQPGDEKDAVRALSERLPDFSAGTEHTLYLTLEPKAGFDRLPPVTESVRQLGVKRVVVGTLDPAQRYRGEGSQTLERMGVEVVLADGEEARLAQQLLEDYSLWLSRGLAVLRARAELCLKPDGGFDLQLPEGEIGGAGEADAVLCLAGKKAERGESWLVVLDTDSWERPAEKTILYQPEESGVAGARKLPLRDGEPDLGALLRDLASLGILSVDLCADAGLFRQALRSGLIASVMANFSASGEPFTTLSRVQKVHLRDGGEPVEIKLGGARLLDAHKGCLEARVELC